jgi:hypothetical protein
MLQTKFYISVFIIILLSACAQIVSPDGGPRDIIPPKIVSSSPINQSTGFNGNQLVLVFDEYVTLKEVKKEVVISPPLAKFPEFTLKGKKLIIPFVETLKENTTYTFNFGKAIVDLNENNVLDSNVFVFSTGEIIDNATIKGQIKQALDLKPAKEILVMLYKETEDSVPSKERPYYATVSKEDGTYKIENIAKGCYKIFALADENNNMLFDQPTEGTGFLDTLVCIDSLTVLDLKIFNESTEKTYLKKSKHDSYGSIQLFFSATTKNLIINHEFDVETSNKKEMVIIEKSQKSDSIVYWFMPPEDAKSITLYVKDEENEINDTLEFDVKSFSSLYQIKKKEKDTILPTEKIQVNIFEGAKMDLNKSLKVKSKFPITSYSKEKIILKQFDKEIPLKFDMQEGKPRDLILFDSEWIQDSSYQLIILPGAIQNVYDIAFVDTVKVNFKTKTEVDYSTLGIKIKTKNENQNFVIELLDASKKPLQSKTVKNNEVYFDYLNAASYGLKLIYDDNQSGDWTSGNYYQKKQAEKIIFHPNNFDVKAGWDMELEWIVE